MTQCCWALDMPAWPRPALLLPLWLFLLGGRTQCFSGAHSSALFTPSNLSWMSSLALRTSRPYAGADVIQL